MKLIDKRNTVIKVLVEKRDKYIFASEILQGNEDKITKDDLDDILDYLFNNGAISYKYLIIDGTETNIPLYRLSVDRLLLIEKAKKLNVSLKSLIQQKQSMTPAEEIGDTNKNLLSQKIETKIEQPKPQAAQDKRKRGRPQIIEEDFPKYLTVKIGRAHV